MLDVRHLKIYEVRETVPFFLFQNKKTSWASAQLNLTNTTTK